MTEEKKGKIMNLKLLWYCTKNKPYLFNQNIYENCDSRYIDSNFKYHKDKDYIFNGKIACVSDYEVEKIELLGDETNLYYGVEERACLTRDKIEEYFGYKNDYKGYAIHIKNLNIFDKPKELNAFYKSTNEITFEPPLPLIKAPQNMCYAYDKDGNKYVVISIRPQWLMMILNGLKTIEVRKQVLNCMKGD